MSRLTPLFFLEKKRRVDEFIQNVWGPIFALEFFSDPRIDDIWKEVVQSQDPKDRLQFIVMVGPKLQEKINKIVENAEAFGGVILTLISKFV